MDSTQRFIKKYNLPKNKQIKGEIPTPDQFSEYEELCKTFILFFEEFSGRRVNVLKSVENLVYFFDQGFELDDLINYVRAQQKAEFFLTNPEIFTISHLFPIRDADRCNAVWDKLAYQQSLRVKPDKKTNSKLMMLACGHQSDDSYSCIICIGYGVEFEIMKNPYSAAVPPDKQSLADFFKRQGDESLSAYAKRTFERRNEIVLKHTGKKITKAHFEMLSFDEKTG